jgi:hypothetical protein
MAGGLGFSEVPAYARTTGKSGFPGFIAMFRRAGGKPGLFGKRIQAPAFARATEKWSIAPSAFLLRPPAPDNLS